jgi:CRP-like cAMP-binding protein
MNNLMQQDEGGRRQKASIFLTKAQLFQSISQEELRSLLNCLHVSFGKFEKGQYLLSAGDPIKNIGIILSGSVDIIKEDAFGRRVIVTSIGPLDMFAEALVCAQIPESPVSVVANSEGTVCFIDYKRIVTSCGSACGFHTRMIQNMLGILAFKSILFNKKLDFLLLKSMRQRISAYLLDQYKSTKTMTFTIPFNREELADYLAVDRSAMSRELGKMKQEGLIDYKKNKFILRTISLLPQ